MGANPAYSMTPSGTRQLVDRRHSRPRHALVSATVAAKGGVGIRSPDYFDKARLLLAAANGASGVTHLEGKVRLHESDLPTSYRQSQ